MAVKNRYYINMNDGRVIAGTEETKDNIFYKEIDISWAIAIRDEKVTAKDVINMVNAKVGMIPFSEMMNSVQKMNVRTKDLHMEDHAQGADASVVEDNESESVIGKFSESAVKDASVKTVTRVASRKVKTVDKLEYDLPANPSEKLVGESESASEHESVLNI